jgi:hypothetical protein
MPACQAEFLALSRKSAISSPTRASRCGPRLAAVVTELAALDYALTDRDRAGQPRSLVQLGYSEAEPGKGRICRISHFEILSALDAYHFTEGSA